MEVCPQLSLQRQCELIGIARSGFYYEPVPESAENLALMRRLDELHLERPVFGSRRLTAMLRREGCPRFPTRPAMIARARQAPDDRKRLNQNPATNSRVRELTVSTHGIVAQN